MPEAPPLAMPLLALPDAPPLAVPLPNIGLALEFGERASIVEEPADEPMPLVALAPLLETDGLLLPAVEPMPFVEPIPLLAAAPGPHGCGLTLVLPLLRLRMPPLAFGEVPAAPDVPPLMPAEPVEPAPPPPLPPPPPEPPPPDCAKAAVLPAARNAAVRMARL